MSQPGSNSKLMLARPSRDRLLASVTPSIDKSAGSKICTIPSSTSSAPAPCHLTSTAMLSTMTSGKNCDRIRGMLTKPATIKITNKRFAAVLCRVK